MNFNDPDTEYDGDGVPSKISYTPENLPTPPVAPARSGVCTIPVKVNKDKK